MKVVLYGNGITHYPNELAFKRYQAMRHHTIQTNNKQNGIDFSLNDAATVSGKETITQQNGMDYTFYIGLTVVAVIFVVGYYYWMEEKKKKMVEVDSNCPNLR